MSEKEWTEDRPTVDGWYWTRSHNPKGGMSHHSVLLMAGWVHTVYGPESFRAKDVQEGELEWYGPLTPPPDNAKLG